MFKRRKAPDFYSDPEVLRLLKERDRGTQERVFCSLRERLRAVAFSVLRSKEEADALVSDLFTDFFYRHVDGLRRSYAIPAYLKIMAVRRARRQAGRARRQVPLESLDIGKDPTPQILEQIDRSIWYQWLVECLAGLSDRARTVLKMHYGHEMSYAIIAGHLGRSKQAVGKTVLKSLEALRRCLERHRAAAAGR